MKNWVEICKLLTPIGMTRKQSYYHTSIERFYVSNDHSPIWQYNIARNKMFPHVSKWGALNKLTSRSFPHRCNYYASINSLVKPFYRKLFDKVFQRHCNNLDLGPGINNCALYKVLGLKWISKWKRFEYSIVSVMLQYSSTIY